MWVQVRDDEGHRLFDFDPTRDLVQVVRRGKAVLIDLEEYRRAARSCYGNESPKKVVDVEEIR